MPTLLDVAVKSDVVNLVSVSLHKIVLNAGTERHVQ